MSRIRARWPIALVLAMALATPAFAGDGGGGGGDGGSDRWQLDPGDQKQRDEEWKRLKDNQDREEATFRAALEWMAGLGRYSGDVAVTN